MNEQFKHLGRKIFAAALFAIPTIGQAQDVLTITSGTDVATLSFEDLLALPQSTVITKNDYVDVRTEFTGPSLLDILVEHGISKDETLIMRAINDFSVEIPASDAFDYNVILALFSNGEQMSVRDKGPIWLIYPMDDHEELRDDRYNSRIIWQLRSIVVE